jgi:hypothetical protein
MAKTTNEVRVEVTIIETIVERRTYYIFMPKGSPLSTAARGAATAWIGNGSPPLDKQCEVTEREYLVKGPSGRSRTFDCSEVEDGKEDSA